MQRLKQSRTCGAFCRKSETSILKLVATLARVSGSESLKKQASQRACPVEQCSYDTRQNTRVSGGVARLKSCPIEECDARYNKGISGRFFGKCFLMARFFDPKSADTVHICCDIFCCIARPCGKIFPSTVLFLRSQSYLGGVQNSQGGREPKKKMWCSSIVVRVMHATG